ncbi:SGNH/GDSL hydrolase family protein [Roseateles sp. LKC17W]|uniref:SGNH/GDSL hydrolase family protein n=1 Tax=Pelomonas margarita TaxID=3299031 RepID=A0ABW7FIG8_9BURK
MPDLAQGYSADIVLAANESVRVRTSGQVTVTSAYGAPAGTTTLNANTQLFGPYGVPAKLRVTAVSGAANYAQPTQVPVTADPATGEFTPPVSGAWNTVVSANVYLPTGFSTYAAALPNWRAGAQQTRAGVICRIAWPGNSTAVGYGALGAANYVGIKRASPTSRLAALLDTILRPTGIESWMGNNGSETAGGTTFNQYFPSLNPGAGWVNSPQGSLGKNSLENSTTTNALPLTASVPVNTGEIFYFSKPVDGTAAFGTFTVNVDGGATLATVDCNAAKTMRKQVVTFARGYHTLNVVPPGGGVYVVIAGMIAYDSENPGVQVLNLGYAGGTAATLKGSGTLATSNVISTLGCKLIILGNLINDWVAGTNVATFKADTQTLITAAKNGGACDVVLITDIPTAPGVASYATQAAYLTAYRELAAENSLILIDWYTQSGGTYEAANAAGLMYDDRHESALGYTRKAEMVASVLAAALR